MKPLTAIQKATLDFIRVYIGENGAPPTNAELAAGMGWDGLQPIMPNSI